MEETGGKTEQPVEAEVRVPLQDEIPISAEEEQVAKQSWKMPVLYTIWFLATICNMFAVKIIFAATNFSWTRTTIIIVQLASISLYSWTFGAIWGVPQNTKQITWKRYLKLILPVVFSIFVRTRFMGSLLWTTPISDPYSVGVEALYPICMLILGRTLLAAEERINIGSTILIAFLGGGFVLTYFFWNFRNRLSLTVLVALAVLTAAEMANSKKIMKETGMHSTKLLSVLSGIVLLGQLPWWLVEMYGRIHSPNPDQVLSAEVIVGIFVFAASSWLQTAAAFSLLSISSVHHYLVGNGCNRIIRIVTFMVSSIGVGVDNGNQSGDQAAEASLERNKRDSWSSGTFSARVNSTGETNKNYETSWSDHKVVAAEKNSVMVGPVVTSGDSSRLIRKPQQTSITSGR